MWMCKADPLVDCWSGALSVPMVGTVVASVRMSAPQHFELQPNEHRYLPPHPFPPIFIQLMPCLVTCEAALNYPLTDTHPWRNMA